MEHVTRLVVVGVIHSDAIVVTSAVNGTAILESPHQDTRITHLVGSMIIR